MFIFIPILLLATPIVELYVLIKVGAAIGAIPTIMLVVFSAVLGAQLLRWQGFELVRRVRTSLARGETPAIEMLEGVVVMLSGALLLFPGFVTDAIGLLLLLPVVRRAAVRWFLRRHGLGATAARRPSDHRRPYVIEGEFRREKDER